MWAHKKTKKIKREGEKERERERKEDKVENQEPLCSHEEKEKKANQEENRNHLSSTIFLQWLICWGP